MQRLIYPLQIIFIILFIAIITACSSSSYSGRYERTYSTHPQKNSTKHNPRLEDEIPYENENYEYKSLINKLSITNKSNPNKAKLLSELVKFLDTPYLYGGNSKNGIDCSAFTQQVFDNSLSIKLPRTAREQFRIGKRIGDLEELKFGDLIYFDTSRIHYPGHVGIYLGENLFAHASSSQGVIISNLENSYYVNKFIGASRLRAKKNN